MRKITLFIIALLIVSNVFAINAPTLLTPSDGSTGWYSIRSIQCYIVDGITDYTKYTFEMDITPDFNSASYTSSVGTDYYSSSGGYIRKSNEGANSLQYGTTYYWRVKVTNGTETSAWSETRSFTTQSSITLSYPANNATGLYTKRSIRCNIENYNTDVNNYEFEMDTTPNFNSTLHELVNADGYSSSYGYMYKNNSNLRYGTKYYWRARVKNVNSTSEWSEIRNFTTLDNITLDTPTNNSTGRYTSRSIICDIEPYNTNSANYDFEMDTVPTFDSPMYSTSHGSHQNSSWIYKYNSNLRYGTKYYWRARVRNAVDTSQWSAIWNFTTLDNITLDSPSNNSTGNYTDRSIICDREYNNTAYDNYEFEIDTTPNFNSSLHQLTHGTSYNGSWIYKSNTDLLYGTKYYWRARVRNAADTSQWSSVWNFTTLDNITLDSPANNSTGNYTDRSIICDREYVNTSYDNYEFEIDTTPNFNSSLHQLTHGTSYNGSWIYKSNTDLLYGTKYYWRARVRNSNDTSQWSSVWNFTTLDNITLDSPANNSTGKSINQSLICDREYVNTAYDNYEFELDTTPNFNSPLYITAHGDNYSGSWIYKYNSGLRYGQKYYWRAKVRNSNDTSQWSSIWNFKTAYELTEIPVLVAPINNSTSISYTSFSIDWNSITGANNYQYQVSTTNDFTSITKSGNTSLTDKTITNLQPNTIYYWRVRGENVNGYSNWSAVWSFTTDQATMTPPNLISPANNSTEVDYASVDFSWNSVFGANNYTFEISHDNTFASGVTTLNEASTNLNLINLDNSSTYYWRVSATDGVTTSDWSSIWSFTTKDVPVTLASPTLVSPTDLATNISTSPTLDWNEVTSATSYEYQYDTSISFDNPTNGTTANTEIGISGLSNATEYYWKVRATDGTNFSEWSNTWSFTTENTSITLTAPVLVSPADFAIDVSVNPTLDWNAVAGATSYEYQYDTSSSFITPNEGTTANTEIGLTGLSTFTGYYWRVRATDGTNFSDWSEEWNFRTEDASTSLDAPILTSPVSEASNQATSLTLDWETVTGATTYEYQYSNSSNFTTSISDVIAGTDVSISGLNNGTTYYWRVRASNGTATSDWSEVWNFTTISSTGLVTPTLISPSNGASNQELALQLLWNIVPGANEYEYQYSTDNTFATHLGNTTQSASISIADLDYSTTYFWRIKATDGTDFSDWSEVWSFTTKSNGTFVEKISEKEINLYPNPATDYITIDCEDNNLDIEIYNIQGKLIFSRINSEKTINISKLNSGTYFIRISKNQEILGTKTFIKK